MAEALRVTLTSMLVLEVAGGILLAWFVLCGIRAAADIRDGK